jgi:predicted GNAT family acetyltransferase
MYDLHPLDNPIWHALNTEQAHLTIGTSLAKRYQPGFSPAVGLAEFSAEAFHDLAQLVPTGESARVYAPQLDSELPGWTVQQRDELVQMVCEQPVAERLPVAEKLPAAEVVGTASIMRLTEADVPDMLALTALAKPGPFQRRTIEMGRYFGIRCDGQLVAMAGERFHLTGYREVSAVCTHPDHRGKGYARQLVGSLVNDNFAEGIIPFLHAASTNAPAIHLYEALNFRVRRKIARIMFTH